MELELSQELQQTANTKNSSETHDWDGYECI